MYHIREARPDEYARIVEFQLLMALETEDLHLDMQIVNEGVKSVFEDRNKGIYYVAEVEGEIVASLLVTPEWSDWRNGTVLWIQSVYVVLEHRKRGLFKMLYNHLKALVDNTEAYKGLRLYVDRTNLSAKDVYKAIGMNGEHYQLYEWMK